MTRDTLPPESSERLLERAVTRIAGPELRSRVIGEAMRNAGLLYVPTEGAAFHDFVEGPLRHAADALMGEEASKQLREELLHETGSVGDAQTVPPPAKDTGTGTGG